MINGTIHHTVLGMVTMFLSMWWHGHAWEAFWVMLAIEAAQIDAFGLRGRVLDTLHDLIYDFVGSGLGLFFYTLCQSAGIL